LNESFEGRPLLVPEQMRAFLSLWNQEQDEIREMKNLIETQKIQATNLRQELQTTIENLESARVDVQTEQEVSHGRKAEYEHLVETLRCAMKHPVIKGMTRKEYGDVGIQLMNLKDLVAEKGEDEDAVSSATKKE
jgi:hypothetical protein